MKMRRLRRKMRMRRVRMRRRDFCLWEFVDIDKAELKSNDNLKSSLHLKK